jgi:hypothetical protein
VGPANNACYFLGLDKAAKAILRAYLNHEIGITT